MSLDGFIDDASSKRLILSNQDDFERVDAVRASCDAIMVGANTLRKDRPRLLLRAPDLRSERRQRGQPESPIKVTVTASGKMDLSSPFFQDGDGEKIVYATVAAADTLSKGLADIATVVGLGDVTVDFGKMLLDLGSKGVQRLLVEGGTSVITQMLASDLVDEMEISIAPFFVGHRYAPRIVESAAFRWSSAHRMTLVAIQHVGDMAVLRYALSERARGAAAVADADGPHD